MFVLKKKMIFNLTFILFLSSFIVSCGSNNSSDNKSTQPKTDVAISITYEYDDLNRIKKTTYSNGQVILYTYDKSGNIVEQKIE